MGVHASVSAHKSSQACICKNRERQADCIFEAVGVRMSENEQQELLFNQDGQMGSGKFSQSLP